MHLPLRTLVALSLSIAAFTPALADDFVLEDVTLGSGAVVYRAKRIEATGANISKEDALKLLATGNATSAAERFAQIDAARIVIPELASETKSGGYTQNFVYRDVVIQKMAHGVAESVDSSGASVDSRRDATTTKGAFGAFHMEGVDFPAATRMTVDARKSPDEPKRQTAAAFTMESMEIDLPEGGKMKAGKMTGRNFAGRPLAAPMTDLVELAPKPDAAPSDATRAAMAAMSADFITSVDVGVLVMNDLVVSKDADARAPATRVSIKRLALDGLKDGKLERFTVDGVDGAPAESFHLDRVSVAGLDARPTFVAAASATKKSIPHFDSIEISGLNTTPDGAPVSLGRLLLEAKNWGEDAPANLSAKAERLLVSLAGAGASRAPALAALGYAKLDLAAALGAKFDAERKEFSLDELSLRDNAIGALRLGGFLAHVSPDLISGEENAMKSAIAAIVFWRADLHVENLGGLDRFVAAQAKAIGKSPENVRDNLAAGGRAMTRSLFAPGAKPDPRVDGVADAVATFLKGAKNFDLRLSAPDGLGAIDLMMAGKLGALSDRLKIEAKAR